jgi:drug/metabolite transporter (DMT)-like permease
LIYLLALGSAVVYGAADFLGGLASRRASTIVVLVIVQGAGLVPFVALLLLVPAEPTRLDLLWGGAAGLAGSAGIGLLYRALAIGTMSIVAPTTAVCAVVLPVAVDALGGQRLAPVTWGGIGLALVAIVLVSRPDNVARPSSVSGGGPVADAVARPTRLLALAVASGVGMGFFFIALSRTSAAAGLWPLLASRSVCLVLFLAAALGRRQRIRLPGDVLCVALACGVLDMLANALYLLATRGGPLSVVVTLASLYPASTVLLARVVLGERLSRLQTTAVACALGAVVVIVSGL